MIILYDVPISLNSGLFFSLLLPIKLLVQQKMSLLTSLLLFIVLVHGFFSIQLPIQLSLFHLLLQQQQKSNRNFFANFFKIDNSWKYENYKKGSKEHLIPKLKQKRSKTVKEKNNIAIAILEKGKFDISKIISLFRGTNNIFAHCIQHMYVCVCVCNG